MTPDMRSALAGTRLPKAAIALVASLLIGFAIGSAIYGLSASRNAARVSDADYVLMVADLYEHEKSVYNARERLQALGRNPLEVADAAAEVYAQRQPEARRDVDSLRQLSAALRQAEAEAPARGSVPAGTLAVVVLIALSIVLGAGAAWLWKRAETGGVRLPYVRRSGDAQPSDWASHAPRGFGRFATALSTTVGRASAGPRRPVRPSRPARPAFEDDLDADAADEPAPVRRRPERPAAVAASHARPTFESTFGLGEDPYDSIHPIHDAQGDLIGACGLSATEAGDRPGRYYGFTAWLQDYSAGNELAAVGLVTRAGQIARSAAVNEWLRRGTIDDVLPAERGAEYRLTTANATVRLTVVDTDYAAPSTGSPGYFGRLTVRFEIL